MSEDQKKDQSEGNWITPHQYWRKNITCVLLLLCVWFTVSLGCGVLFVDELDKISIPGTGFKLGFWFAQQGSIVTFVLIILFYVVYMNRLDKKLPPEKKEEPGEDFDI